MFKQGNLTAQSVTENFKWKFCDHNFQKKKWMKHNKKEYRESVSVCGRFELNEWYYWFVQEKKFYEVTSEFERRLCEKDLKQKINW